MKESSSTGSSGGRGGGQTGREGGGGGQTDQPVYVSSQPARDLGCRPRLGAVLLRRPAHQVKLSVSHHLLFGGWGGGRQLVLVQWLVQDSIMLSRATDLNSW